MYAQFRYIFGAGYFYVFLDAERKVAVAIEAVL
jgi:hypothetical protein